MEAIKTYYYGTREFQKLNLVAEIMSYITGLEYVVDNTYFDYGQDWKWTTILRQVTGLASIKWCQAISPAQQEIILRAETIDELVETAKRILEEHEEAYNNHSGR